MSTSTTTAGDKRTRKNSLGIYFREINGIPVLSRAEEQSLARSATKGDRLARDRLIQANLRFVVKIAKGFHTESLPLEDLISEGNIGLMNAIQHFDPGKGHHFVSYAVWWIRQAIMKAIGDKSRMIRLPQNKALELLEIAKVRDDLQSKPPLMSKVELITQKLHSDRRSVTELLNISREVLSLEAPLFSVDGFSTLEDFIEDKNRSQPEQLLMAGSLRDDINRVLSCLSPREAEILRCRYGLNGRKPMTLREIGTKCKVTRERIRQIEKKAMKHIRRFPRCHVLQVYEDAEA